MLESIHCPKCNRKIVTINAPIIRTNKYYDCLRRCENCGIGFSNSNKKPTIIYKNPFENIPKYLHSNLEVTIKNSFNIRNRKNKWNRIGFNTSEDALTWSFFKYLENYNYLITVFGNLLNIKFDDAKIYYWGYYDNKNELIISELLNASDYYGENTISRTEPDIIILFNKKILIFIEVKYLSANTKIPKNKIYKIDQYLRQSKEYYIDRKTVKDCGYYELIRNWSIGCKIREKMKYPKFYLLNICPKRIFSRDNTSLTEFSMNLKNKNCIFSRHSFEELYTLIPQKEKWFMRYFSEKIK
jgi:hypothetical protein